MKRMLCVGCGKIVNPKTLICDACGTDYNEKPKCEHFYTEWQYIESPCDFSVTLRLKCEKCNEIIALKCSEDMFSDMISRLGYGR